MHMLKYAAKFLSIQAQDFIEDGIWTARTVPSVGFLSIQAQDFIEERRLPSQPVMPWYS